eukprot:765677-Hanusia_phi.AAC.8
MPSQPSLVLVLVLVLLFVLLLLLFPPPPPRPRPRPLLRPPRPRPRPPRPLPRRPRRPRAPLLSSSPPLLLSSSSPPPLLLLSSSSPPPPPPPPQCISCFVARMLRAGFTWDELAYRSSFRPPLLLSSSSKISAIDTRSSFIRSRLIPAFATCLSLLENPTSPSPSLSRPPPAQIHSFLVFPRSDLTSSYASPPSPHLFA